jgi:5S rRNA maturation endonuclease (ribonuclease M5)
VNKENRVVVLMWPDARGEEIEKLAEELRNIFSDLGGEWVIINKELHTISMKEFKEIIKQLYSQFIEKGDGRVEQSATER